MLYPGEVLGDGSPAGSTVVSCCRELIPNFVKTLCKWYSTGRG
jgi:hypothetical protein